MTLFRTPLSGEEEESDQKKMSFQKSHGKAGRISMWVFPSRPTIGTFSPSKTEHFLIGGNNLLTSNKMEIVSSVKNPLRKEKKMTFFCGKQRLLFLIFFAVISALLLFACSSTPSNDEGKKALEEVINRLPKESIPKVEKIQAVAVKLIGFKKTNSQEMEFGGAKAHSMEFEADIEPKLCANVAFPKAKVPSPIVK